LNCPEKWEKAWYIFYIIKPQGGLDNDMSYVDSVLVIMAACPRVK